jgi:hypothetical protein
MQTPYGDVPIVIDPPQIDVIFRIYDAPIVLILSAKKGKDFTTNFIIFLVICLCIVVVDFKYFE